MRICIGGTFDRLHAAHRVLLDRAFEAGGEVFIGLTEDRLVTGKGGVESYEARERALGRFLKSKKYHNYHIVPISRSFGIADTAAFDGIVVSEETVKTARRVNAARKRKRLRPLKIYTVGKVYAKDLIPLSSTRIRKGFIDSDGNRLKGLTINVGSLNGNKLNAARNVFAAALKSTGIGHTVRGVRVRSGVREQPRHSETERGAVNRAKAAVGNADFGVGIEAGLFRNARTGKWMDVQYCAIIDSTGRLTIGHGSGFAYPDSVIEELDRGRTVSEAFERVFGVRDIGRRHGAIGHLSGGLLDREKLTEQAVLMALVPRIAGRVK